MTTGDDHEKMGECVKCGSSIPVDTERCRECGYEPGAGALGAILGGVVMWIAFSTGMVFALIAVISLILIFDGFPVVDGLTVFLFTGGIGAVLLGIAYAGYAGFRAGQRRGPTDPPTGERGDDKSISESWQEGAERGDAIADKIGQLGPAIVAVLPGWAWTVGVLLGVVLHLLLWVVTGQESEIGMSVALLGGVSVSFAAIVADTFRVKWKSDYFPRWWFWTFFGILPLFGWIFGLLWLARKRQKTGSVI